MNNSPNDSFECNSSNKDALIKQLRSHIKGMEQNEIDFGRLNNKFIELQKEFISLSEEKTQIEASLRKELSISNKKVAQLKITVESLQQELLGKNILNKKQRKDLEALEDALNSRNDLIGQLKAKNKQLREDNNQYELAKNEYKEEQLNNQKQIDYLKQQIEELAIEMNNGCNNDKRNAYDVFKKDEGFGLSRMQKESRSKHHQGSDVTYYETQLNHSNETIKRLNMMIKELESQIEELQKEINLSQFQSNPKKSLIQKELEEKLMRKQSQLKLNKSQIEVLEDEKSKLIEDNTKMYSQIDKMQHYIMQLDEQNKQMENKLQMMTTAEVSFRKYKTNQQTKDTDAFNEDNDYKDNSIEDEMVMNTPYYNKTSDDLSD